MPFSAAWCSHPLCDRRGHSLSEVTQEAGRSPTSKGDLQDARQPGNMTGSPQDLCVGPCDALLCLPAEGTTGGLQPQASHLWAGPQPVT